MTVLPSVVVLTDDLASMSETQLLARHSAVLAELRRRNVLRSKNNPTGDYAEWLVSTRLQLTLENNSAPGFDARDALGVRYQIKARRVTPENPSTQLSVLRNLLGNDFDMLVAVLFDTEWMVIRAAMVPHSAVVSIASFRPHVNGHVVRLNQALLELPGVRDVTHLFR
jgi:hypothetical protein